MYLLVIDPFEWPTSAPIVTSVKPRSFAMLVKLWAWARPVLALMLSIHREEGGGPRNPDSQLSSVSPDERTSPMTGKRKWYSADFKAKVALDAIRGEQTIAQLSAKHGIHQTMINAWKKQAIEGMSGDFSGRAEAAEAVREGEIDQLHAKIGQ